MLRKALTWEHSSEWVRRKNNPQILILQYYQKINNNINNDSLAAAIRGMKKLWPLSSWISVCHSTVKAFASQLWLMNLANPPNAPAHGSRMSQSQRNWTVSRTVRLDKMPGTLVPNITHADARKFIHVVGGYKWTHTWVQNVRGVKPGYWI